MGMNITPRKIVLVCADGSGEYTTLSAAAAAQDPAVPVQFLLGPGVYRERPFLELADYVITGAGVGSTVLTAGVGGFDPWPGETKTGTFRSWTLFLGGGCARVEHMTIENTAGDGAKAGQALAVYADASRVCMVDVALHGNQDTLFTAPLPLAEREPHGFRGPREDTPRLDTRQYYRDCTISGNIDFIFGGANAVFDHCRIVPLAHKSRISYITAANTPQGKPGYLFAHCTVKGTCPTGTVYLGRPWRAYARVFWLDCDLSAEIHPDGWDNWNDPANEATVHFGESGSRGPGASSQRAFGTVDSAMETADMYRMLTEFRQDFGFAE